MTDLHTAAKLALDALGHLWLFSDEAAVIANPAITALREALAEQPEQQESETITQTFTGIPKRKLRDLLSAGWQINGVCFQRTEEDGTVRRGAATTGGMVLWWNTEQPAQQEPLLVSLYNRGYKDGHNDTVEGCYVDVFQEDTATYHADIVSAWLEANQSAAFYTTPQPPEQQDIPDLIAGALGVSRGTAYDLMRAALAEQPAPVQQEQSNKSLWMDCTALADAIHYPDCWDTGAYPELDDALHELAAWFKVSGCTTCAAQPAQEPFGYFKAEPFGWTDCAETDEGAVALYDRPQAREPLRPEQTKLLWHKARMCAGSNRWTVFKKLIEAAHGIGVKK